MIDYNRMLMYINIRKSVMQQLDNPKTQYPLLLKLLFGVSVLFFGSLGILLLSLILSMLSFAYGLGDIVSATVVMEQMGIGLLGLSILVGGAVSIMGLTMRSITPQVESDNLEEKQKNENRLYDIREHGLTVEDVLGDMTMQERELLAEKLAESRLAIREDGTLIPLEQAEKLQKIERFI